MNDFSTALEALGSVLQAICWPSLVLILVIMFRKPLKNFFSNLGEFTFKAGASGLEASAKKFEAAANLAAATAKSGNEEINPSKIAGVARTIEKYGDQQLVKLVGKRLLWVDDKPSNNVYERGALEALGIEIVTSLDTNDALDKIRNYSFDVIVSDMGRPEDKDAGVKLLDSLKQMGNKAPYILYTARTTPQLKQLAANHNAFGITNIAKELFELVLNAIL